MPGGQEEINLAGQEPAAAPAAIGEVAVNQMQARVPNLAGMVAPGASNEELVATALALPEDQYLMWEDCHLPSKGLYYGWPDGIIQVRPMGQMAEKILATQRLAESGQSIDMLFRHCCRFPGNFDAGDLLLGDRVFLLYYLRGITHGNLYEFAVTCSNEACQATNTYTYDMNQLAATIRWGNPAIGSEPFKVILPYYSQVLGREFFVRVRFLRATDSSTLLARRKLKKQAIRPGGQVRNRQAVDPRQQQQQSQSIDDTLSDNLEQIIVSVCDTNIPFAARNLVQKMHATDTATVREWLRENTPGIDNIVVVTCQQCNNSFSIELPITESFFRPTQPRGIRP